MEATAASRRHVLTYRLSKCAENLFNPFAVFGLYIWSTGPHRHAFSDLRRGIRHSSHNLRNTRWAKAINILSGQNTHQYCILSHLFLGEEFKELLGDILRFHGEDDHISVSDSVADALRRDPLFAGIAVHDFTGWRRLAP